jgi:hypothetical protein
LAFRIDSFTAHPLSPPSTPRTPRRLFDYIGIDFQWHSVFDHKPASNNPNIDKACKSAAIDAINVKKILTYHLPKHTS